MYDGQYPKTKRMSKDQFAELTATVVRMLPRDLEEKIAQGWIDDPKLVKRVLNDAFAPPQPQPKWGIEETIKLGTTKGSSYRLRGELRLWGRTESQAADLMRQKAFTVAREEIDIDILRLTPQELGFQCNPNKSWSDPEDLLDWEEIVAKGAEHGLKPLPAEAGPQLLIQGQLVMGWTTIVMNPIVGSDGEAQVFNLKYYRGRLISLTTLYASNTAYSGRSIFSKRDGGSNRRYAFMKPRA